MPDDLRSQLQPLLDAVEAMGLPLLRITGVEADDVIGTLARQAAELGHAVLISTGDKDMAQLVDARIGLVNTMSNTRLDRDGVKAKFDVFPEQIIDYLALVGDSSDNIPGVTGVGPKTAAKWLNQYQTLDGLIANSAAISGKVGENLRGELPTLELSRKLATIHTSVPLTLVPTHSYRAHRMSRGCANCIRGWNCDRCCALDVEGANTPASGECAGSGRRHRRGSAGAATAAAAMPRRRDYEKVVTQEALDRWLAKLQAAPLISFDTETDSLDYLRAQIVGLSFAVEAGRSRLRAAGHDYPGAPISWIATRCSRR
jgi:DNA polymerase-1